MPWRCSSALSSGISRSGSRSSSTGQVRIGRGAPKHPVKALKSLANHMPGHWTSHWTGASVCAASGSSSGGGSDQMHGADAKNVRPSEPGDAGIDFGDLHGGVKVLMEASFHTQNNGMVESYCGKLQDNPGGAHMEKPRAKTAAERKRLQRERERERLLKVRAPPSPLSPPPAVLPPLEILAPRLAVGLTTGQSMKKPRCAFYSQADGRPQRSATQPLN